MTKATTHYETLQVREDASPEAIKGAYKHLSQRWHPDKNPEQANESERITQSLNEAYSVLSDPERRQHYDAWLAEQRRKRAHEESSTRSTFSPQRDNEAYRNQSSAGVDEIVVKTSKRKSFMVLLLGSAFLTTIFMFPPPLHDDFGEAAALLGVLAGAILVGWSVALLFSQRRGLVLNRSGVCFDLPGLSPEMVPWSEIVDVRESKLAGVLVIVATPQEYMRQLSGWDRFVAMVYHKLYGTPIVLSNMLTSNVSDLLLLLREYKWKYDNT